MSGRGVLVLAHAEADGTLSKASLEAIGTARTMSHAMGTQFSVGLVGHAVSAAAGSIGACGASRVLGVSGEAFAQPRYVTDAMAAEALGLAAEAEIIIAPGTSRWMRVLSGTAERLGGRVDTHVTRVSAQGGVVTIARWFYKQRIEGEVSRSERPWIIVIEPGTQEAWSGAPLPVKVESVPVERPSPRTSVIGLRAPVSGEQTVRSGAELLLVAGAGWTKKQSDGAAHVDQAESLILTFLRQAQASLGGSKSLVDQGGDGHAVLGFMTHLNQVGQTGSSPRHRKGLATCCHGEEPHVVGWRFINERRAVNLNPNCGWAQGKADVVYVADAFQVMAKVNELLASE
jgi:electron transfer flavoprotein alpha subunit